MTDLTPVNVFSNVRQLETTDLVLAGPGQPMNEQAQSLLNRTEFLKAVTDGLGLDIDELNLFKSSALNDADLAEGVALFPGSTRQISTIAELRTYAGRYEGDRIDLLGHTDAGIGAGPWRWSDASTADDDNGAIVQVAGVLTGRWLRIFPIGVQNVDMWGADPSGVRDSLAAAMALRAFGIASGNRVGYWSAGNYSISSAVLHQTGDSFYNVDGLPPNNGFRWIGAGMRATRIVRASAGGAGKHFQFDGNMNNNTDNLTPVAQWWSGLEEMTLASDSNTFTANTSAVYWRAIWGFYMKNVNVERMPGDGLFIDGVTTPGTDDADGSANNYICGFYGQEGGGKAISCERSKCGSMLVENTRFRGWFRGGFYVAGTNCHFRNTEWDAIGSVGNTDATPFKFCESQTLAANRGMHIDGAVIENCPWLSVDVEHCHSGSIKNVVLHPFLNLSQAGVITQPKLFRFEKPTGNGNVVRNFEVHNIEIQPYSVPIGDTREFQFIDAQGAAELDVRNVERRTPGVPDLNMYVIGSGTRVSLDGEALTAGASQKSMAYFQVTTPSAAVTGAGAAQAISTAPSIVITTDSRKLLSINASRPAVTPFMLSSYIKIGGVLQLGGMATTHTGLLVELLKNGGSPVTVLNIPLVSSSQATRSYGLPPVLVSCTKNDVFDYRITVSGTGATVTIGTGTRYNAELT